MRVSGSQRSRDVELGMARAVDHPLAEEPVDDLAGRVLDGAREVARLDDAVAMLAEVVSERLVERVVAEHVAQHVQDAAALLVQVVIEDVDRLVVELGRDRAAIAAGVLAEVALRPLVELEVGGVAALVMLAPDVLGVGREALVEPALAPVAARDQIAEPLVRELVRDQRVDVVVDRGALVEQHVSVSVVALVFSMPPKMKSATNTCAYRGYG